MLEDVQIQRVKQGVTTLTTGGTPQPIYKVPAPGALTDDLAGAGAGLLSDGVYKYKVSYVLGDGRETEAGTASGGATVADYTADGQLALTNIPLATNFNETNLGQKVVARKIYRTEADGSDYKFLVKIEDNTTEEYTDNIADADLGEDAPSTMIGWDIPVKKLVVTADASNSVTVYLGGSSVSSSTKTGEPLIQTAISNPIENVSLKDVWFDASASSQVISWRYEQ